MNANISPREGRLAEIFGDALRYWELRRLAYNGALVLTAFGWLIFTWPHFRPALNWHAAGALALLAILANLCYSIAYLAELPIRRSAGKWIWLRWRWLVWVLGMLFALALETYWIADEIYPNPLGY
jgi:hypothetical protein